MSMPNYVESLQQIGMGSATVGWPARAQRLMGPQIPLPDKCYDSHSAPVTSISCGICHSFLFVYFHDRPPDTKYCDPLFF